MRLIPDHAEKCFPIAIHGDGFPCMGIGKSWGKVMDSWQWSSLLSHATSKCCVWMIFCVHQVLRSSLNGFRTLDEAFAAIAWSFNAIYNRRWPTHNWLLEPLNYPKACFVLLPHMHSVMNVLMLCIINSASSVRARGGHVPGRRIFG